MSQKIRKIIVSVLTLAMLLSVVGGAFQVTAFDYTSSRPLPHTGAVWKAWRQGGGNWGSETIGTGTTATMAMAGCFITSMAMGAKSYGDYLTYPHYSNVTPLTTLEVFKEVGAVLPSGDFVRTKTYLAFENLDYMGSVTGLTTLTTMTNSVASKLNDNSSDYLVVITFNGMHQVIADHVTSGVLYVYDPAIGAVTTLSAALNRSSAYSLSGYYYFEYYGYKRGDADHDGYVTSSDARLLLQFYAGSIPAFSIDTEKGDFDGDGEITSTDAQLILSNYAGN